MIVFLHMEGQRGGRCFSCPLVGQVDGAVALRSVEMILRHLLSVLLNLARQLDLSPELTLSY